MTNLFTRLWYVTASSATLLVLSAIHMAASPVAADEPEATAVATFAGGCFWCMEAPFDKLDGVSSTVSGYMGGNVDNPTYRQVSGGGTGHAEVVQVTYDPTVVSYEKLLEVFWRNIDPLDAGGQFCDRGDQYRSGVFYHTLEQREAALSSREELRASDRFDKPVVTEVTQADTFYRAEDYHQNYYVTNPVRYRYYRFGCRRDARLEQLWGEK